MRPLVPKVGHKELEGYHVVFSQEIGPIGLIPAPTCRFRGILLQKAVDHAAKAWIGRIVAKKAYL